MHCKFSNAAAAVVASVVL